MSEERHCGSCKHFKNEDVEGNGLCERLKQVTLCSFRCNYHKSESDDLSRFEKKCLALNIGYDHDVCDGKYCAWKLTCLRYMLYKKAELEGYNQNLMYQVQHKFNYNQCYLKHGQENK